MVGVTTRDADNWFSDGADAAHTAYLDALGHVDASLLDDDEWSAAAAAAVDDAHQAVTPLTARCQRRTGTGPAGEWVGDDRSSEVVEDDSAVDEDRWSR